MTIPANFRVPKNLHHEWLLFYGTEMIAGIRGVPGKKLIEHGCHDPRGEFDQPFLTSRSLDWIQESVEHLRFLCEK